MKKKLITIICMILIISLMTGCTTFTNFKNAFFASDLVQTETIKIGVFEPLSGKNKDKGKLELMGIELAHELKGEVLGKKIELVITNNKGEVDVAETVVNELVAAKPSVILGSYGETMTLIASDAVKEAGIPAIAITSTNPLITINNNYYFCATFADAKQGDALADFVYTSEKIKKAATVKISGDDTATAAIQRFKSRMKSLTKKSDCIVGNYTISVNETDYTETLGKIKSSKAKAVFLDVPPATAEDFLKQAHKAGLDDVLFVGPKTWNDNSFKKFVAISKNGNVAYAADYSIEGNGTSESKVFLDAYKAKYGEDAEPAWETAVAYDAYMMAVKAIEKGYKNTLEWDVKKMVKKASTKEKKEEIKQIYDNTVESGIPAGVAIRDALKNLKGFKGASGKISYNGSNEAAKTIEIVYYKDGVIVDHGHTVDNKDIIKN